MESMSEQVFLILTALADQPRHGYGITEEVHRLTNGKVRLRTATLYAALDRLAGRGTLTVDREEAVDGRLRRYYRITEAGTAALDAEATRMAEQAALARKRLNTLRPGTAQRVWGRPVSGGMAGAPA